jgi:hypothetical protein
MRKILAPMKAGPSSAAANWLDVEQVAEAELTSEDAAHPIESALRPGEGPGWLAAEAGTQVIRLHFDVPQHFRRIRLVFHERDAARTQEFALRWSADRGQSYRELVRQQFNFSPPGTTLEIEDYAVDLGGVSSLELSIVPNLGGGEHRASLAEWRLA